MHKNNYLEQNYVVKKKKTSLKKEMNVNCDGR